MIGTIVCTVLPAAESPVDLDVTIILQVILFFLLLFFLTFLLYRPLLNLLEARFLKTEGLKEEAGRLLGEAAALERRYDDTITTHRKEAERFTAELRQKVRLDENEILEKAKRESAAMIAEARVHIKEIATSMRKELTEKVEELSESLASKLLSGGKGP
jgi:F-type H+-transporting ATPase subunit b